MTKIMRIGDGVEVKGAGLSVGRVAGYLLSVCDLSRGEIGDQLLLSSNVIYDFSFFGCPCPDSNSCTFNTMFAIQIPSSSRSRCNQNHCSWCLSSLNKVCSIGIVDE